MDGSSPENTMIARSLKDLSRFLTSSNRVQTGHSAGGGSPSPRMQLSFSDRNRTLNSSGMEMREDQRKSGVKRKASDHGGQSLKKHHDSVTGLDVCKILREKDIELVDARAMITKLKTQLSSATTTHSKLKLDYDSELSQLRLAHLKHNETVEDLQVKLKNERQQCDSVRGTNSTLRDEMTQLKSSSQLRVTSTTTHYTMQHEQRGEELSALREKFSTTEKKLHDKSAELDLAEMETTSLREQVSGYVQQVKQFRTDLMMVDTLKQELSSVQASNRELEGRLQGLAAQEQLASAFESSVQRLPDLEMELGRLKEENEMLKACGANTRLLEEQVASATDQIKLLQQRCDSTAQLQAQLQQAKSQLAEVSDILRTELSLSCSPQPEELKTLLRGLRSTDKSLTDSIQTMKDSVSSHERQCALLEKETKELRDTTAQQQQLSERHLMLARRLQRKLILVSKERDSLKAILTSYEAEATMTAATAAASGRLSSLEESLALYRQEIEMLEVDLDYLQHAPLLHGDTALLTRTEHSDLKRLQEEVAQLQEQVSKLQEEKEILEYRLEQRALKGDYDPTQVNVLHMKANPTSEAVEKYQTEVARLEAEVKRLNEQLVSAQHNESVAVQASSEATAALEGESAADKSKMQELEKTVKSMEVKHQRLIEAFKSKSKEMRQLVYRLTGYDTVPAGDNCYKLSNIYAESADDYFMFEFVSNGEIRLLSTEFSNSLEDLIDAYLNQEQSYPAFLSAVTIDLFNRQTKLVAPSVSSLGSPAAGDGGGDDEEEEEDDDGEGAAGDQKEDDEEEEEDDSESDGGDGGEVIEDDDNDNDEDDDDNDDNDGVGDDCGNEKEDQEVDDDEDVGDDSDNDEDDDDDDEDDEEMEEDDDNQIQNKEGEGGNGGGGGGGGGGAADDEHDLICLD